MKKNNKGFTLAELLIVVAILGILVVVAIPTFRQSTENANRNTTLNNLRAAYSQAVVEMTKSKSLDSSDNDSSSYPVVCQVAITGGKIKVGETQTALDALGLPFTGASDLATSGTNFPQKINVKFHFTYNDAGVMTSAECQLGDAATTTVTLATIQAATNWSTYITAKTVSAGDTIGDNWFVSNSALTADTAPGAGLTAATSGETVDTSKSYYSLNSGYTLGD